jgi:hypothetical protein
MKVLKILNLEIFVSRSFTIRWIPRVVFYKNKYSLELWVKGFGFIIEIRWGNS